jgi:uncharacterized protein (DUF433 family)/DNA-binding transcriptional MerR regulator
MDVQTPLFRGVYDGHRTAALAGVPYSTLHCWAREGIVVPSISREKIRLWSWTDLLKLRAVTWLRKQQHVGMPRVRTLLGDIEKAGLSDIPLQRLVLVSLEGDVFLRVEDAVVRIDEGHQIGVEDLLDLIAPFDTGPDLLHPRPLLRISPGKLSGQPHVEDTRIGSLNIYSLHQSGYSDADITAFYPTLVDAAVHEAIDLETSLDRLAA